MIKKGIVQTIGTVAAIGALALAGMFVSSPRVRGSEDDGNESKIQIGFKIAPVPLHLEGLDLELVGLGSYIVNTGVCNDCHDTGPAAQFAVGGNPFFGQPKKVNPKTYLGGGRVFAPVSGPPSPPIISRNLTPSTKTGLPEGDHTFPEFLEILRT